MGSARKVGVTKPRALASGLRSHPGEAPDIMQAKLYPARDAPGSVTTATNPWLISWAKPMLLTASGVRAGVRKSASLRFDGQGAYQINNLSIARLQDHAVFSSGGAGTHGNLETNDGIRQIELFRGQRLTVNRHEG